MDQAVPEREEVIRVLNLVIAGTDGFDDRDVPDTVAAHLEAIKLRNAMVDVDRDADDDE
jgi:hypothetical protein